MSETDAMTQPNSNATTRLRDLRDALLVDLVERDVAMRLALLATLAGEHLLLVGPPGTAKSLLARRLQHAFIGATYFERLLTRFSVPEELFGPLSINALQDDRYERLTKAYLPQASIAFLDEIFKANSAILNSLLTLLNEREFDNGTTREKTPLVAVIGASNELPKGDELDALFDRFLLRLHVGPVSKSNFQALLNLRGQRTPTIRTELQLSPDLLKEVGTAADAVEVPSDVIALLTELREHCAAEKIPVSDRRWRKIVKLLQVSAWTNGRQRVSVWDAWLLQHCLWEKPEQRESIYRWYAERVGATAAMDPSRLTKIVLRWEGQLKRDAEGRSQAHDAEGNLLYVLADGKPTTDARGKTRKLRKGEPLYLAPSNTVENAGYSHRQISDRTNGGKGYSVEELDQLQIERRDDYIRVAQWPTRNDYLADRNNYLIDDGQLPPFIEPTRHKVEYVESCKQQIDEVKRSVTDYAAKLGAHRAALESEIRDHLWVTADFAEPAAATLRDTAKIVEDLARRVALVRAGFEGLPRDVTVLAVEKPPVGEKKAPEPASPSKKRGEK